MTQLNEGDLHDAQKIKLARDVMDEVSKSLRWRFWSVFAFVVLLGYFGGYELIRTTAQNVTKELNYREIVNTLVGKDSFNEEVIGRSAKKINALIEFDTTSVTGNSVACTVSHGEWAAGVASIAKCPPRTVRVGGGCDFTCLGSDHETSGPTNDNGWTCRQIARGDQKTADDAKNKRTFHAVAVCLNVRSAP